MNAMVLCAGPGTRLRPLTESIPKPLVRIAGFTLLLDTLHHLSRQGVRKAVINASWQGRRMEEWLHATPLPLETVFQPEEEPLGTAGAVRRALPHLGDAFLVVYGDNLSRQPFAPLVRIQEETGAELVMALSPTGQPSSKGIVLTGPDRSVEAFREKPPDDIAESNMASSGLYFCLGSAMESLEDGERCDFGLDLLPRMLSENRLIAADTTGGYTRDTGTWRDYHLACHDVLSGRVLPYSREAEPVNGVLLENDQDWSGISLNGTIWTEAGSRVGEGCVLNNCVVLEGAVVGRECRLANALVMPGSSVPDGTVADDKYLKTF
ncbi:MAG: hypothetical protein AVO35_05200 [Candidatus Aegiribacteria sp. MLS_C]|nr:MAG: hypothetical protein AVO35_05200 [Candidatus Aegiribacteria sp. MLS_C]